MARMVVPDYSIEQLNAYTNDHALDIIRSTTDTRMTFEVFPHMEYAQAWMREESAGFMRAHKRLEMNTPDDVVQALREGDYGAYEDSCGTLYTNRVDTGQYTHMNHVLFAHPYDMTPAHRYSGGSFGYQEIPGLPLTGQRITNAHELGHVAQFSFGMADFKDRLLQDDGVYHRFQSECFADAYSIAHTIATHPAVSPRAVYDHVLHMRVGHGAFSTEGIDAEHHTLEALGGAARLGIQLRTRGVTRALDIATHVDTMVQAQAPAWWDTVRPHQGLSIRDSVRRDDPIATITRHGIETAGVWTPADNDGWIHRFARDNPAHMPVLQRIGTIRHMEALESLSRALEPGSTVAIHPHALGAMRLKWATPAQQGMVADIIEHTGTSVADVRDGYRRMAEALDHDPRNTRIHRILHSLDTMYVHADRVEYVDNRIVPGREVGQGIRMPASPTPPEGVVVFLPQSLNKAQQAMDVAGKVVRSLRESGRGIPTVYVVPHPSADHSRHLDTDRIRTGALSPLTEVITVSPTHPIPDRQQWVVLREGQPVRVQPGREIPAAGLPRPAHRAR